MYIKREAAYATGKATMFAVVLGQCTKAMKAKLEAKDEFETISEQSDVIPLLQMIHGIAYNHESERYPVMAVVSAKKSFYTQTQKYHRYVRSH